ncbi:MAG: tol-pal system protein YbgF [Thermodesulfobacteriota bacterium]|nr:tol-pal system protein YbgF [Thermodesulfobacteriota bacterium]
MRICLPLLVTLVASFLFGCVATMQQARDMDSRLDAIEQRLYKLQSRIDFVEKNSETRRMDIREAHASLKVEFRNLRESLQQLRGELETTGYALEQHKKDFGQYQTAQNNRLASLEKTVFDRIRHMEAYLGIETPAQEGDDAAENASSPAGDTTGQVDNARGIQADATEDQIYTFARQVFDLGDYAAAREAFEALLKRYPGSDKSDNARFWIGETYYREKWYEKAILEYQQVIDNYPEGNKVPDALLKQGIAFHQIGENMNGRLVLKKLIKQYPDSNQAALARKQLDTF